MTEAQPQVQKSKDQALKNHQAILVPFEHARTSRKIFRSLVQEDDEPIGKFACRFRRMANKALGQPSEGDRDKGMYFQFVDGLQTESVLVEILNGPEEDFMTTIQGAERIECLFGDFESKRQKRPPRKVAEQQTLGRTHQERLSQSKTVRDDLWKDVWNHRTSKKL